MEPFRFMLAGGHPNSLGRTVEVVDCVFAEPERLDELFDCYGSDDEVVRLRTSSAIKRVFAAQPPWFDAYAERLLNEVAKVDQPSAKWTLAQIFLTHGDRLNIGQMARAKDLLVHNLHTENDWIVLNMTMKTCQQWLKAHPDLVARIRDRVRELASDPRKSVAKYAGKVLKELDIPSI